MIIRPYTAADRIRCLEIFDSNTPKYFMHEERDQFIFWLNAHDKNEIAYKETLAEYYYVIETDGTIMGCGGYGMHNDEKAGSMIWGMIAREQHKKGLGKALFAYRLQQMRELYPGYSIQLDTSQHTYPFFEKFGFKTVKITENGYGQGLHRYDMILE